VAYLVEQEKTIVDQVRFDYHPPFKEFAWWFSFKTDWQRLINQNSELTLVINIENLNNIPSWIRPLIIHDHKVFLKKNVLQHKFGSSSFAGTSRCEQNYFPSNNNVRLSGCNLTSKENWSRVFWKSLSGFVQRLWWNCCERNWHLFIVPYFDCFHSEWNYDYGKVPRTSTRCGILWLPYSPAFNMVGFRVRREGRPQVFTHAQA